MRHVLDALWIGTAVLLAVLGIVALGPAQEYYGAGGCLQYSYSPSALVLYAAATALAARPLWHWSVRVGGGSRVALGMASFGLCALALASIRCGWPYASLLPVDPAYFGPAAGAVGVSVILAVGMGAVFVRSLWKRRRSGAA
ncbi:hypothetical protein B1759_16525 [Rubrivirga sp. SAORIC476]|nr:hypothetical protein B1759_16525 [Rubrivirga sp. SAORIC476]